MKKLLTLAIAATMTVSAGAWAACTADIDMGGQKITNATMSDNATASEVATKAYVDAKSGSATQISGIAADIGMTLPESATYCAGTVEGTMGWRLPTYEDAVNLWSQPVYIWISTLSPTTANENLVMAGHDKSTTSVASSTRIHPDNGANLRTVCVK